jgi:hypothetical protein
MKAQCIACGYDAQVTMVLDEKSELGALGTIAPKSFCVRCMYSISKAYKNLSDNNHLVIPAEGYEND